MNRFVISTVFCTLALISGTGNVASAEEPEPEGLHIEAQPLSSALREFSEQTGLQIGYAAELASGKETEGVAGVDNPAIALDALLASTGLEHRFVNAETVVIRASETSLAETERSSDSGNSRPASSQVLMAQNQTPAEENQTASTKSEDDEEEVLQFERITVTGTNIRGIAPDSSPVRIYTREDIQITGAGTAQDFIQTLPANFGGGSNADLPAGLPNDSSSNSNTGIGSSVNLRGLGSGSTLVLLNGRRVAPSSGIGDFVDISMIPATAIERVEVLTDGASSIYGSDAVAGVVNFILRDDFEGLETSLRYGVGTQNSSPEEFRAGVTGGLNWESGHALVAYEYFNQDEIGAQDRSFSQGALLPNFLRPSQERHSVLGSLSQDLTSNLEVFSDITYSKRHTVHNFTNISGIQFSATPTSKNLNISAGGTWKVSDSWFVDFTGTYSEVNIHREQIEETTATQENDVDSKAWIADVKTSGTILRLPGGDVKLAMGGHFRTEDFSNIVIVGGGRDRQADRDVYAAFGEVLIPVVGSDNAVPGIERLELNVSGRYDHFSDFGSTANPKIGILWSPFEPLNLRGSYSTSFNPPALGIIGDAEITISAIQTAVVNAIFGLTPGDPSIADVVSLTAFGTSKNLAAENSRAFTAGLDFNQQWGRHKMTASTTWFDIKFEDRLGETPCAGCVEGNIFDAPNVAFNNPDAFPPGTVIFSPTIDQINDLLNSADRINANRPPVFGDPFDAEIINLAAVVRNLGLTLVSGLDFGVLYTYELDAGNLILGIDGTYLNEFKQQAAVTTPVVEQVNTLFNPVDLKLRGRVGYAKNGLTANVFVNYANDYRVDNTANAMRIDSRTTVDLSLSYDTQNRMENSIFSDTVFRLSVINLTDEDPPATPSNLTFGLLGFDPANASPLGRFVGVELTKRF